MTFQPFFSTNILTHNVKQGNLDSYKHTSKPLSRKAKEHQAQALRDDIELRQRQKGRLDKNGGGEV